MPQDNHKIEKQYSIPSKWDFEINKTHKTTEYLTVSKISGSDFNNMIILFYQSAWEDFPDDESTHSYIVYFHNQKASLILEAEACLNDLWLSPSGDIYLVGRLNEEEGLYRKKAQEKHFEKLISSSSALNKIWALNENYIFVWGNENACWLYQEGKTKNIKTPFPIFSIHGTHKENIIALGDGLIHYQNENWIRLNKNNWNASYTYVRWINNKIFISSFPSETIELWNKGFTSINHQKPYPYGVMEWGKELQKVKWPEALETSEKEPKKYIPQFKPYSLLIGKKIMFVNISGIFQTSDFINYQQIEAQSLEKIFEATFWVY